MARYIKVNAKVVEYLDLAKDRYKLNDGNYLLWQSDMLKFGKLADLPELVKQIGGVLLTPHEAREEQEEVVVRHLPTATDSRFVEGDTNKEEEV